MSTLSVSSYSLREHLGPLSFDFTDGDGNEVHLDLPNAKELDLSDFPARARSEFGVQAIETVAFQFTGPDDPELDRFAAALTTSGVRLINAAIDQGDLAVEPSRRADQLALITPWIDRFAAMGSAFVRVNPGSPFGPHAAGGPSAHLVEALIELGGYARDRGTRLLVENHGGPSSDPAWLIALLDAVGREQLGLLLDLGNFEVLTQPVMAALFGGGEVDLPTLLDGLDLTSLYDDLEALAGRAELAHVKVHDVAADGTLRAVDLDRSLGILAAHDYRGPLTIEYEGNGGDPWWKTGQVVDAVRAFAARPAPAAEGA
ncbi:sugar phosphate isomerase/epimerase family protein [Microlunatus speluncae]|uniref:sugar phosphate isomerase/epimerase family protein n=1 Tax=Microlunatus speluncae TaxID=2594267 RepID=UPI0012668630|nr:TIM barrel protein [Microlunatus speluncae]